MEKIMAKMTVSDVQRSNDRKSENVTFRVVPKQKYDEGGLDENNTFAQFDPKAVVSLVVSNPEFLGTIEVGDNYSLAFTKED